MALGLALLGAWLAASAWPATSLAAAPARVPSPPAGAGAEPTAEAEPTEPAPAEPTPAPTEPAPDGTAPSPDLTAPAPAEPAPAEPAPAETAPTAPTSPVPPVAPVAPVSPIAPSEPPAPAEPELDMLSLRVEPGVGLCLGRGCRSFRVGDAEGSIGVGGSLAVHLAYRAARHLSFEVGGLAAIHGNDIDHGPASLWFLTQAGPRLHLFGGRWPAEPVLGLHVGWVRSLVRWTDAGSAADGLALGADVGVQLRLTQRLGLAFLGSATLPYWTRVCEADQGIRDCHRRSELTNHDLQRYFFVTSVALIARLR